MFRVPLARLDSGLKEEACLCLLFPLRGPSNKRERHAQDTLRVKTRTLIVVDDQAERAFEIGNEVAKGLQLVATHSLVVLDFDGDQAEVALQNQIDLAARRGPVVKRLKADPASGQSAQDLLDDHAFPGLSHGGVTLERAKVGNVQKVMKQAGVAQIETKELEYWKLGMLVIKDLRKPCLSCRQVTLSINSFVNSQVETPFRLFHLSTIPIFHGTLLMLFDNAMR
jgi:hypothetical protein